MDIGIGIAVAVVLLVVAWTMRPTALKRGVTSAMRTGDVGPLVNAVIEKKGEERATAFNFAAKRLWDAYRRDLTALFVATAAPRMDDVSIVQYWLKQVMEVEPEVASEAFDDELLQLHYKPEVAQKCGSFG